MIRGSATQTSIPYEEYRAINQLVQAHFREHGSRLRAVLAFGDLVTAGDGFDIDLLEVVEEWHGPRLATFSGTSTLPLRGRLHLYFVSPQEFRSPSVITDTEDREWIFGLVERVREGYQVIFEQPSGFVRRILEGDESIFVAPPPSSGSVTLDDPLALPKEAR